MTSKQPMSFGSSVADKVALLVQPMATDLGLEIYDIDYSGGVLKVVLDTPPGGPSGVSLDSIALVTRLLGRELDHSDPIPGRYTLEVTSPGLERTMRRPEHFAREVGKVVNVRLHAAVNGTRRVQGLLAAANENVITVRGESGTVDISLSDIERARTVFEWGPAPKPGKKPSGKKSSATSSTHADESTDVDESDDDIEFSDHDNTEATAS
jgi:ribosome maturation factor RimP